METNAAEKRNRHRVAADVETVVTSYNQGDMILEAVRSLWNQTLLPAKIIITDDGSSDENSVRMLKQIESDPGMPVPTRILRQENRGVSAARNNGIRETQSPIVLVLDGDDRLKPTYIEQVVRMLRERPAMIAASSWMQTFGVMNAVIKPAGGDLSAFLSRNCCPATHMFRREVWEGCGGYDESMRSGFEDWDFFLGMLETAPDACIGIVPQPLIDYRTAPASSNVRSMAKRLELMRFIIEKHMPSYRNHIADAILGIESISMSRLYGWESEILCALDADRGLGGESEDFMKHPSYGDGGMAAAVRIVSSLKTKDTY